MRWGIEKGCLGLALGAALTAGCAHESIWLGDPIPSVKPPEAPIGLTLAVREGAFEDARIKAHAVVDRFAAHLREAQLVQAVMYPIPAGTDPLWVVRLSGSDTAVEPDSNFWRSFFARLLPPLAFFIWLQNDYTLELEALVIRDRVLVGTYVGRAPIRNRYQIRAPYLKVDEEALELAVRGATQMILASLSDDVPELRALARQ